MEILRILFVCIGNTCRSPMAEAIMTDLIKKQKLNWFVDSAGLRDWNDGIMPNVHTVKVLNENGLATNHIGRKITAADFYNFDYILAMDNYNMHELKQIYEELEPKPSCKIELLGSYLLSKEDENIRDPFFADTTSAFRHVFIQIFESCKKFIEAKRK